jgi:hypothetical protein
MSLKSYFLNCSVVFYCGCCSLLSNVLCDSLHYITVGINEFIYTCTCAVGIMK